MIRQRRPAAEPVISTPASTGIPPQTMRSESPSDEQAPLLQHHSDANGSLEDENDTARSAIMSYLQQNRWMVLAIASGACAAFNGVFAKLTTTDLTTNFAHGIARLLRLGTVENAIEYIVRAMFFGLNLIFNGVMWTLFTQALAKGNSTTQVSIMNTSSNFVITAVLGFLIFSESLPPLWWVGAALLVAGNVIIGSQDESDKPKEEEPPADQDGLGHYRDVPLTGDSGEGVASEGGVFEDEDIVELGDLDAIDEQWTMSLKACDKLAGRLR